MRRQFTRTETHPGLGRQNLYVVTTLAVRRCTAGQVGDVGRIERRCEAREHSSAQGSDDFVRRAVTSQNDGLYPRPDGTHLLQQRQIFFDSAVGTGDYDTELAHAQPLQRVGVPHRVLHGKIGSCECFADRPAHFGIASNDQDPTHAVLRRPARSKYEMEE